MGEGKEEEGKGEREIESEALEERGKTANVAYLNGISHIFWGPGFDSRLGRLCQSFTYNFPFSSPFLFLSFPFPCDLSLSPALSNLHYADEDHWSKTAKLPTVNKALL